MPRHGRLGAIRAVLSEAVIELLSPQFPEDAARAGFARAQWQPPLADQQQQQHHPNNFSSSAEDPSLSSSASSSSAPDDDFDESGDGNNAMAPTAAALDALGEARERCVDVARVTDRLMPPFVTTQMETAVCHAIQARRRRAHDARLHASDRGVERLGVLHVWAAAVVALALVVVAVARGRAPDRALHQPRRALALGPVNCVLPFVLTHARPVGRRRGFPQRPASR